jgi:hypothetical protein
VSVVIQAAITTTGAPINLNSGMYRLAAGTFEGEAVTHRKQTVTNSFVEGSYTVNSLRENVVTPVNIWIETASTREMKAAVAALKAAFDQISFNMTVTWDDYQETWFCEASDYTETSTRELLHSHRSRLDVQLVRQPAVVSY